MTKRNDNFFYEKKAWSKVKDELLACYLTPYIAKILTTRKPLIYVDCFAGKGKFDDGNEGSPIIALKIIQNALQNSSSTFKYVEANFIELEHHEQLAANLKDFHDTAELNIRIHAGNYEDKIREILNGKTGANLFLYIDPYGIRYLDFDFFTSLIRQFHSVELLINLNSLGFLREACRVLKIPFQNEVDLSDLKSRDDSLIRSRELLNRFAGGNYWEKIICDFYENKMIHENNRAFYDTERKFVEEYCNRIRRDAYEYVLNMPISVKLDGGIKYRMIYATNHDAGAILMADNIFKRKELMRDIQLGMRQDLFAEYGDTDEVLSMEVADYLSQSNSYRRLSPLIAKFFTVHGVRCSSKDFVEILKKLEAQGKITVCRNPAVTKTGKPTKFFSEKGGQTLELKWNG